MALLNYQNLDGAAPHELLEDVFTGIKPFNDYPPNPTGFYTKTGNRTLPPPQVSSGILRFCHLNLSPTIVGRAHRCEESIPPNPLPELRGMYYLHDNETGQRVSLETKDKARAAADDIWPRPCGGDAWPSRGSGQSVEWWWHRRGGWRA